MRIKIARIRKLSRMARYPRSFEARLANIDAELIEQLTARQVAAIIDGPMDRSWAAGVKRGYDDAAEVYA